MQNNEKTTAQMDNKGKGKDYENFASGLLIVRSENSNFNADFTHTPRRLPDEKGTIYATDKSLKYCIRKYLKDNKNDNDGDVFVWRRKRNDDTPMKIEENYEALFSKSMKIKKENNKEKKELPDKPTIIKDLLSCIDIRLFGVTFAPGEDGKNVSITGPIQISYGVNRFDNNVHYTNQILSPYQPKERGQQTTIGEESKALELHYTFDFIVNPNHLKDSVGHLENKGTLLAVTDISLFKEAARKGVTNVNSTTKIGSENELFLYIEYDRPLLLQNLKDFVTVVDGSNGKRQIDLSNLMSYLTVVQKALINEQDKKSKVGLEVYYEPEKVEIIGLPSTDEKPESPMSVKKCHLITGEDLEPAKPQRR